MKKHVFLTSLVAIAMSCPAFAATDVTFGGTYNGGLELKEPADVTYSYVAGTETVTGVAASESPDKTKFTYTGTDGSEKNLDAGDVPTQSDYTANSSASGVVSGPSELVSGMTLNKSDYTYKSSQTDENGDPVYVALGDAPLDVVETVTLLNEAATEITVKNGEATVFDGTAYSTVIDGITFQLSADGSQLVQVPGGVVSEPQGEARNKFEAMQLAFNSDKDRIANLVKSTESAYATEIDNFNLAQGAFDDDMSTLAGLDENFATVGAAVNDYNAALQAQSTAQATYAEKDKLYQDAKAVYDAPILETITDGANDAIDSALAEGGAIRSELDQKVNLSDAEAIFAEKQQWVDNTLGIESAKSDAVADALTGEIAGNETTFSGAINAIDNAVSKNTSDIAANKTAIETNATNIATNATNIAANKTAIESEVARATAAEAELDGKIALNTAAIEEEVANRIAGDEMTLSAAKAYADAKNTMSLKSAYDYTDKKVDALEEELSAGIASAAAMSSVAVSNVAKGEVSVGGGYGYYNSQSAVALGAAMGLTDNWSVNAAAGLSDSNVTFRAGTNYKFKLF